jgi:hypothetical protein
MEKKNLEGVGPYWRKFLPIGKKPRGEGVAES